MSDTTMGDNAARFITAALAVIPESEEALRSSLAAVQRALPYSAPEVAGDRVAHLIAILGEYTHPQDTDWKRALPPLWAKEML